MYLCLQTRESRYGDPICWISNSSIIICSVCVCLSLSRYRSFKSHWSLDDQLEPWVIKLCYNKIDKLKIDMVFPFFCTSNNFHWAATDFEKLEGTWYSPYFCMTYVILYTISFWFLIRNRFHSPQLNMIIVEIFIPDRFLDSCLDYKGKYFWMYPNWRREVVAAELYWDLWGLATSRFKTFCLNCTKLWALLI